MKTTGSSPSKSAPAGGLNGSGNGSVVMNQPIYQHPANLAATSGFQDSVASRTAAAAAAANSAGALNASLLVWWYLKLLFYKKCRAYVYTYIQYDVLKLEYNYYEILYYNYYNYYTAIKWQRYTKKL